MNNFRALVSKGADLKLGARRVIPEIYPQLLYVAFYQNKAAFEVAKRDGAKFSAYSAKRG